MKTGDQPIRISVPITDVARLELRVDTGYYGHDFAPGEVWWGDARLVKGQLAKPIPSPDPPIPSPPSQEEDPVPGPNGKKVLRLDPEKLEALATKLKAEVANDPDLSKSKPKLAVAAFKLIPAEELAPSNVENVREDLSNTLINTKAFTVVERGQLDQALKELKIQLSDTFDSATAQKLGKLVGARVVLIGSISDRGNYTIINARLIDTATGEARMAASVELRQ